MARFGKTAVNVALQNRKPTPREQMLINIEAFSDIDLQTILDCLYTQGFNSSDEYSQGISMDDWAEAVYSEMNNRKFKN